MIVQVDAIVSLLEVLSLVFTRDAICLPIRPSILICLSSEKVVSSERLLLCA